MVFRIERATRVGKQTFGRHDIEGPLRLAAAHGRAADQWSAALTGIAQEYADYKEQEYDDQEVDADLEAITGIGELEATNAGTEEFDASTLDESHPSYSQGTSGDAPVMVPGYTARPDTYRIGAKRIAEQASKRIQDPRRQKEFMSRYLKTIEGKYAVKKLNGLKEAKAFHDRKLISQIDQAESNDKYAVAAELIKGLPEDKRIEYTERNADRSADSVIAKARLAGDVASLKQKKAELTDKDYNGPLSAGVRQTKAAQIQGDIDRIEGKNKEEKIAATTQLYTDDLYSTRGGQGEAALLAKIRSRPLTKQWTSTHRDEAVRRTKIRFSEDKRMKDGAESGARQRAYKLMKAGKAWRNDPNLSLTDTNAIAKDEQRRKAGVEVIDNVKLKDEVNNLRFSSDPEKRAEFGGLDFTDPKYTDHISTGTLEKWEKAKATRATSEGKKYTHPGGTDKKITNWLQRNGIKTSGTGDNAPSGADLELKILHEEGVNALLDAEADRLNRQLTEEEADKVLNKYFSSSFTISAKPNVWGTVTSVIGEPPAPGDWGMTDSRRFTLADFTSGEKAAAIRWLQSKKKPVTGKSILDTVAGRYETFGPWMQNNGYTDAYEVYSDRERHRAPTEQEKAEARKRAAAGKAKE